MSRRAGSVCRSRRNPRAAPRVAILHSAMARPSKEPPSRSSIVPTAMRHASKRGLDVEALAWRFGLPGDVARRDEVSAGADVADALLHAVARGASEPDVAFRVASEL